jgi:hypothetical protein
MGRLGCRRLDRGKIHVGRRLSGGAGASEARFAGISALKNGRALYKEENDR